MREHRAALLTSTMLEVPWCVWGSLLFLGVCRGPLQGTSLGWYLNGMVVRGGRKQLIQVQKYGVKVKSQSKHRGVIEIGNGGHPSTANSGCRRSRMIALGRPEERPLVAPPLLSILPWRHDAWSSADHHHARNGPFWPSGPIRVLGLIVQNPSSLQQLRQLRQGGWKPRPLGGIIC